MIVLSKCLDAQYIPVFWDCKLDDLISCKYKLKIILTGANPGPCHSHAAAAVNGTMYIYGGSHAAGADAATDQLWALGLKSLIWQRIEVSESIDRPPPLFSHSLCALGRDCLVLAGGCPEHSNGEPGCSPY